MADINWDKTGIPSTTVSGELETGQSTGATINEQQAFVADLGPGPHEAVVDAAYNFAGPDAVVQTREKLEAIEAVEGFGEPDKGKLEGAIGVTNKAT